MSEHKHHHHHHHPHCGHPPHPPHPPHPHEGRQKENASASSYSDNENSHNEHCHHHPHCCKPHCCHPPCGCLKCRLCLLLELCWCTTKFVLYSWLTSLLFKKYVSKDIPADIQADSSNPVKKDDDSHRKLRVAFIGNYGSHCGVATYNEKLVRALSKFCEVKVFAEQEDADMTTDQQQDILHEPDVIRCWSRKNHPNKQLIVLVASYRPDIIHISHEYGLFPKAYFFTSLVSVFKNLGFKVITTFHSVYEHIDKTVVENCPNHIIVHTTQAANCLIAKGMDFKKISVIPHGSEIKVFYHNGEPKLLEPVFNTWHSDYTLFHAGFLYAYKGHEKMLGVVKRLSQEFPDIHYIIQASENPHHQAEHDELYHKIVTKIKELELEHNVTINRGFVSEDILLSYIRSVKCCVLPYTPHPEHNVMATSGIARLILTTETPLITSDANLFFDIQDIAIEAPGEEELYQNIKKVFSGSGLSEEAKQKRIEFLKETSWGNVAKQIDELYHSIILIDK